MKLKNLSLFFVSAFLIVVIGGCGNSNTTDNSANEGPIPEYKGDASNLDPLLIEIRDMEAKSKRDSVIDRNVGLRLLKAYQDYYNKHPKDSLGLAYLYEAARVADAMNKYEKAIDLLINYHDGIGSIEKKAEAAYLVAFIYDAHLHQEKKAIEYYNKVIELYPKTQWAEQAKSALHVVGKSDEELLQFLKEKNKQAS